MLAKQMGTDRQDAMQMLQDVDAREAASVEGGCFAGTWWYQLVMVGSSTAGIYPTGGPSLQTA